ncbi:MAG: PqqD family protein [Clostridia bacterium]|nr:PqqD family protein [Clostridia bacterium]
MKISEGFVVQKIGESFYAVPVNKNPAIGNGMIKLNESAYLMWKKIEEGLDLDQIAEALTEEYNVDKETALRDVKAFAGQLGKVGILEGTNEA